MTRNNAYCRVVKGRIESCIIFLFSYRDKGALKKIEEFVFLEDGVVLLVRVQ